VGTSPGADHPAVLPRKRQHVHRYTKTEPRLPPPSASRSNVSLLLLPPLSIPSFHSPPCASTPRFFPIGVGEEAEHAAARSRVPLALLGQRE
jgi:hypothetical protein